MLATVVDEVVALAEVFAVGDDHALVEHIRFYAINGTLHTYKKCAFLMAYANTSPKDAEAMMAHYKTIADYMGWEDVGSVVAPGIWTAGSIKGTKYCEQAYQLGKNI